MSEEKQTPWTLKEYYNIFKSDRNTEGKFVWQLEDESSNWETIERMVKRESLGSLIFNLTNFIWLQLTDEILVVSKVSSDENARDR